MVNRDKKSNKDIFLEIYNASNKNASNLLEVAILLCTKGYFAQAYVMAYTALEEISKAQFAADVFTGLRKEDEFKKFYRDHKAKIIGMNWAYLDASTFPHQIKWAETDIDDLEKITLNQPQFDKRQISIYVDVDFDQGVISKPSDTITEKETRDIIHIVEAAFERIWEVTGEFGGMQIGTKGFMK